MTTLTAAGIEPLFRLLGRYMPLQEDDREALMMLEAGRIAADGPATEVLSDPLLSRVFGIRGHHAETPDGPVFQPLATTR